MLTEMQLAIINKYVDEQFYDREKLIKYLSVHTQVGNEVFDYVDRKNRNLNRKEAHSPYLDDEEGYEPVPVDTFIRRIPLYFHTWDGSFETHSGDIGRVFAGAWKDIKTGARSIEGIYHELEYMFYEKAIEPYDIFNYLTDQTGRASGEYFFEWVDYLHLCDDLGWEDPLPGNFITSYNLAREAAHLSPVIYIPDWDMHMEKPYFRNGRVLEFEGVFPCDENNMPIMRWIGLKFRNSYRVVKCTCDKAERGYLSIEIDPDTVVYYRNTDDDGEEFWDQVYSGPLTMEFDNKVLKYYRERLKYTQQEVADAVGASIRTYQKWEYGTTQPDGYYLLRLMNWLDIPSIQEAVKYDIPE